MDLYLSHHSRYVFSQQNNNKNWKKKHASSPTSLFMIILVIFVCMLGIVNIIVDILRLPLKNVGSIVLAVNIRTWQL